MADAPKILISVVNWNNYQDTVRCIRLCKEIDYPSFEICVVDNDSRNESVAKIREAFPQINMIVQKKNKGYAAGHYQSYLYAKQQGYDALWIINPDITFRNDILRQLVEAWKANGISLYSSVVLDEAYEKILFCGNFHLASENDPQQQYSTEEKYVNTKVSEAGWDILPTYYVCGASFLLPMAVCDKIGFIRKDYFMYAEEVDYSYYARSNAVDCLVIRSAPVVHYNTHAVSLSPDLKHMTTYYNSRNYLIFAFKHGLLSKRKVLADNHGVLRIVSSLFKTFYQFKIRRKREYIEAYFKSLGLVHALIGIKGKIIDPEDYL
jgi:GT2 family glycosyltransferase